MVFGEVGQFDFDEGSGASKSPIVDIGFVYRDTVHCTLTHIFAGWEDGPDSLALTVV